MSIPFLTTLQKILLGHIKFSHIWPPLWSMIMDLMVCKIESTMNTLIGVHYLHFRLGVGAVVTKVVRKRQWPPL